MEAYLWEKLYKKAFKLHEEINDLKSFSNQKMNIFKKLLKFNNDT